MQAGVRRSPCGRTALMVALAVLSACVDRIPTEPEAARVSSVSSAVIAPPGYIRIGVVAEATQLLLGGTGNYRLLEDETGALLFNGSASAVPVTLGSKAVLVTFWRLQVQCAPASNIAFVNDWVRRVAEAGYDPYTEFVPAANCYRLRVGRFPTRDAALAAQPTLFALGLAPAASGGLPFQVTITEGVTIYRAEIGGSMVEVERPIIVEALSGFITIDGQQYRGIGEARMNSLGSLAGINQLRIEDYLLGVVPRELGPVAFPFLEALKAQAVAARTYALANLGKRRNDGYDLLGTPSDQVYGGLAAEHPLSSQAVLETAGVVAVYGTRLISALYSSTSGGWTANSEDVFTTAEPYLRGVPDMPRGNSLEHVPSLSVFRNHANAVSLRAARENAFEADWAPRHRWYVDWTAAEMRQALSGYFNTDVGEVYAVEITNRSSSGRALRLEVTAENGTFVETKDRIRSALRFYTNAGVLTSLHSTLVYIEPVVNPRTKQITGWEAWGGGWGHGVGMAQTGAVGMAERGYTYDQILKHYYRGISLEIR